MNKMSELERLLRAELYKKSLYEFVKAFWDIVEPHKLVDGKLIQIYCEFFQYLCRAWVGYEKINIKLPENTGDVDVIDIRGETRNLNINVPPRHTKSLIFNVFGPAWTWLSFPTKAASISHSRDLAVKMNTLRQKLISSDEFKFYFPNIFIVTNTSSSLVNSAGGELYSVARNAMTGYGGDILVNDDLTNAETARKDKEEMNNAWNYYQNTMPSRINDINTGVILNIQQRLAPNDITGHILNESSLSNRYKFVILPAKFNKTTLVVCPISGDILEFKKGEYLWPERFGDYSAIRDQVGETVFETQYMQNPIASDKTIIKEDMIIEKDIIDVPPIEQASMIFASHDFPVKEKEDSDYLGSTLGYQVGNVLYIKDALEKHMAYKKSIKYVKQLYELFPGIIQIIEDKANGSPIIEQTQDEVPGIYAYEPGTASKTQRLEAASLYSNNVVLVRDRKNPMTNQYELSPSMKILKQRLVQFPFVDHDDIVDSYSQMVNFVFRDKRYAVYGRSFNDDNIVNINKIENRKYTTIFFNKEGDSWKCLEISVKYGVNTYVIVEREIYFQASVEDGLNKLKEFAPGKRVLIDCSNTDALKGFTSNKIFVERYSPDDFDASVAQLSLCFNKKIVLIDITCTQTRADIEMFKYNKSKNEDVRKYVTDKDGFVACLRGAIKYYGIK